MRRRWVINGRSDPHGLVVANVQRGHFALDEYAY
jgi:hypothetical protein